MSKKWTDNDLKILAKTIYGEARGEIEEGRIAVAMVILNRWRDPKRKADSSITKTCQRDKQFSCWNKNDPNYSKVCKVDGNSPVYNVCYAIGLYALEIEDADDPTKGATHYHAAWMMPRPKWAQKKKPCLRLDGHLFYNNVK